MGMQVPHSWPVPLTQAEAQAYGFSLKVPSSAQPTFNKQIFSQINSGRKLS